MTKIKRRFASLGYAGRKAYWKIVTAKPSIFIVASIIVGASIFLLGGGIFDILQQPLLGIPIGRRVLYFYPGTVHDQAVLESFMVMISYFIGVFGILLMYQSTKYAYKPRQAFILLLVGAMFILIAYINVENLIWTKLSVQLG